MKYEFSEAQLIDLQRVHDNLGGPRSALAYYQGQDIFSNRNTTHLVTEDVEDFIIEFYTQYNRRISRRY